IVDFIIQNLLLKASEWIFSYKRDDSEDIPFDKII
ncbi:unnamed protein product, partial [marine sediment metagenome]